MDRFLTLLLLFLINFTFLLFEVSINHKLSLILGSTVISSTITLSIFMLGLGLGSIINGSIVNNHKKYLSILTLLIGVFGFSSGYILDLIPNLYSFDTPNWIILLISSLIILVLTLPMGGVLPIVANLLIEKSRKIDSSIGSLYIYETLASVFGGAIAGFYFLGKFGIDTTILFGGSIAIVAFIISLFIKDCKIITDFTPIKRSDISEFERGDLLKITALAGGVLFSYQIFIMRALKIYLTNTTYTFTIISISSILGLTIGSFLFKRMKVRSIKRVPLLILLEGVVIALSLIVLLNLPKLILIPLHNMLVDPLLRIALPAISISLILMLPISIISGYLFPMILSLYIRDNSSRDSGVVVFINSFGIVVGSLLSGFLILPLIGVYKSILLVTIIAIIGSLLFGKRINKQVHPLGIIVLIVSLVFIFGDKKILPPSFSMIDRDLLYYSESREGTVSIGKEKNGKIISFINNSQVMGISYDAVKTVKMLGYLPYLIGVEPRNALIVGFGIGGTASTVDGLETIESIDCVELVTDVSNGAKYYMKYNNGVERSSKLNLMSGDGREFMLRGREKYDIISSDPTHPVLGSGPLYTKEYFELCRSKLSDKGVVTQYLPLHKLSKRDFSSILLTFRDVFPEMSLWLGQSHAVLMGSKNKLLIDYNKFHKRASKIKDRWFYSDPMHIASNYICSGDRIEKICRGEVIEDDRNILNFFNPEAFKFENWEYNIALLKELYSDPGEIFLNLNDRNRVRRYKDGRKRLIDALVEKNRGNRVKFLALLRESISINGEDQELQFLLKSEQMRK